MDKLKCKWQGWTAVTIGMDFSHLRKMLVDFEDFLERNLIQFENDFKEKTKNWNDEEKAEYGEHLSDEHWQLSDIFPQTFRATFLSTCFSKFEYEFKELCLNLKEFNPVYGEIDIKQDIIKNCKKYLTEKVKIDNTIFCEYWSNILIYKAIRNCIVHNLGYMDEKRTKEIEAYCHKNPALIKIKDSKLIMEKGFCEKMLTDIDELLASIYSEMKVKNIKTHLTDIFG